MGDVQTGDGIQRIPEKPGEQSLLAPLGGEGGSVLQALGSKEVRRKRRTKRKKLYEEYLASPTWRSIRSKVLSRDKNKCGAKDCPKRATDVHHERYPAKLGQEKLEWLHSVCREHHEAIHSLAASGMLLRHATRAVLSSKGRVTHLEDDWRLAPGAIRKRQLRGKSHRPRETKKTRPPRGTRRKGRTVSAKMAQMNDALHLQQKSAREKRERFQEERVKKMEIETWMREAGVR